MLQLKNRQSILRMQSPLFNRSRRCRHSREEKENFLRLAVSQISKAISNGPLKYPVLIFIDILRRVSKVSAALTALLRSEGTTAVVVRWEKLEKRELIFKREDTKRSQKVSKILYNSPKRRLMSLSY